MSVPNKCPHCGTHVLEGTAFCLHCMHSLTTKYQIPVYQIPKKKLFRISLIVGLFVAIVSSICLSFYYDGANEYASVSKKSATQEPCRHVYSPATCLAPQTCQLCGDEEGSVLPDGHNWVNGTQIVRHPEEGHWEDVEIDRKKELRYLCYFCSYSQEGFATKDELTEHLPTHSDHAEYEAVLADIGSVTDVREVWVPVYESKWIVDKEAYSESVTVDTCSICGASK